MRTIDKLICISFLVTRDISTSSLLHACKVVQMSLIEDCYPTGHNELFRTIAIGPIFCVNSNF